LRNISHRNAKDFITVPLLKLVQVWKRATRVDAVRINLEWLRSIYSTISFCHVTPLLNAD